MRVSLIRQNVLFTIDEIKDELTREHPLDVQATLLHDLARSYYVAALGTLLVEADSGMFRHLLVLGGEARVRLLKLLRQGDARRRWMSAASVLDPFFGCVVAARLDVAR